MEHRSRPFVSAIVPVFNDAEHLKICLEALEKQTYPKDCYEIIVVDNGSDDREKVQGIVARFGQAILTDESIPGSYAARNKGISLAKGEIIAFTDADCIPAPNWMERGVNNLLKVPNCGQVVGKVDLFFKNPNQPTAVELYESITAFPQEKLLEEYKGGATANVFTFREVIDRVGPFDASLKSNGDLEWGARVFAKGYAQIYADDVCVAHPARSSLAQLYKRTIRLAAGSYQRQCKNVSSRLEKQKLFLGFLWRNMIPPLFFVFNAFRDSRLQGLNQKMQVSLIMFFVRYVSAWELCRLQLGAASARE
jgi:glycosyltransferase involved in cell wall biosynthesis